MRSQILYYVIIKQRYDLVASGNVNNANNEREEEARTIMEGMG